LVVEIEASVGGNIYGKMRISMEKERRVGGSK
jgi:hypothetical protein